jgi:hypothetical protein
VISRLRKVFAHTYPFLAGSIFLVLGIATLIQPDILSYYGIGLNQPSARVATRAMIGGGEIGLALVLLFGGRFGLNRQQRSLIAAVILICVGLSRIAAIFLEDATLLASQPAREAFIELLLGGAGLWAAFGLEAYRS